MRYVGGKGRLARKIARHIPDGTEYIEPFIGGGAVFEIVAPRFERSIGSDASLDLMLMWRALASGWVPPGSVSEQQYSMLRHEGPSPLRGLVGYGGSFGGKWFGGYARGGFNADGTPRNHYGESLRNAQRIAHAMHASSLACCGYDALMPRSGSVVYCDPPYAYCQRYSAVDRFDSDYFWSVMRRWRASGAHVLVSEYEAPADWQCIAEFKTNLSLPQPSQGRPGRIERLWSS